MSWQHKSGLCHSNTLICFDLNNSTVAPIVKSYHTDLAFSFLKSPTGYPALYLHPLPFSSIPSVEKTLLSQSMMPPLPDFDHQEGIVKLI